MSVSARDLYGKWKLVSSILRDEKGNQLEFDPFKGGSATITYEVDSPTIKVEAQTSNGDHYAYSGDFTLIDGVIIHHITEATHSSYLNKSLHRDIMFFPASNKEESDILTLSSSEPEDVLGDGQLLFHEAKWARQL